MRINLHLPDPLAARMKALIEAEEKKTGLNVTQTAWIQRAIATAVQEAEEKK